LRLNAAGHLHFDVDRAVHLQQEIAGILQAPVSVGNAKGRRAFPPVGAQFRLHRNGDFALVTVQQENAVKLRARTALRLKGAFHAVGAKNNIRKARALEHFLVHFFVAGIVAALSAAGIHDDFARSPAGRRVEVQSAALERKRSVHRVKAAADPIAHLALRSVDVQDDFTRACGG